MASNLDNSNLALIVTRESMQDYAEQTSTAPIEASRTYRVLSMFVRWYDNHHVTNAQASIDLLESRFPNLGRGSEVFLTDYMCAIGLKQALVGRDIIPEDYEPRPYRNPQELGEPNIGQGTVDFAFIEKLHRYKGNSKAALAETRAIEKALFQFQGRYDNQQRRVLQETAEKALEHLNSGGKIAGLGRSRKKMLVEYIGLSTKYI